MFKHLSTIIKRENFFSPKMPFNTFVDSFRMIFLTELFEQKFNEICSSVAHMEEKLLLTSVSLLMCYYILVLMSFYSSKLWGCC